MDSKQQITFRRKKFTYPEFINQDENSFLQISALLNLHGLSSLYYRNSIIDGSYSERNTNLTDEYSVDWAFDCYKMKKAIIYDYPHTFTVYSQMPLTKQANQVFILAMLYGRVDIVNFYLEKKIINPNQSIFGSPSWPSYFIIACICGDKIINAFKSQKLKYNIGWNGITPAMLFAINDHISDKIPQLDFIGYNQYRLLLNYIGIDLVKTKDSIPIFSIDFACMCRNRNMLKFILETSGELGKLSRLSFVVQSEENMFLILSRYEYRTNQNFLGNTPIHYTCYNSDLPATILLLYLDFPIVKNSKAKLPNEVGSLKAMEKSSILFNLCTTDVLDNEKDPKRVFMYSSFQDKMYELMNILKFNNKDYDKYVGIFRYLKFNKNNKVATSSRFSIFNMLSLSKTSSSVEQSIKKMSQFNFTMIDYNEVAALRLFKEKFYN